MRPRIPMGDVRVKVRLSNAMDEALVRRKQLVASEVRSIEVIALVDTGATFSAIPAHLAELLGVQIIDRRVTEYADGRQEEVGMTEPVRFDLLGRDTADEALVLGDEVLIGQTVLEKLDLLVDCKNQRLIPKHPEGFITSVKRGAASSAARNEVDEVELVSR